MDDNDPRPDGRRSSRLIPRRTTRIICYRGALGLGKNLTRGVKDISQGGVCLLLAEELPVDQEVEIQLESIQHSRPLKVPGKVAWVRPVDDLFLTGILFDKALSYRDLQTLGQIG
jgi:hypothetical protein